MPFAIHSTSPGLALAEGLEVILVSLAAAVVKLSTGAGRGIEVESKVKG